MSRSFKNNPINKDNNAFMKKYAQRVVRRYRKDIPNGGAYRKLVLQWDYCDWFIRKTWPSYCKDRKLVLTKGTPEYKKHRRIWRKLYSNK